MLYSRETICVNDQEQEVYFYLKSVRNHSFRITASKISMTLPNRYKHPDTIEKYKMELLDQIKKRLEAEPKWLNRRTILTEDFVRILNVPFRILRDRKEMNGYIDFDHHCFYCNNESHKGFSQRSIKILIQHYEPVINARVRHWNQITTEKNISNVKLKKNFSTWGLCSNKGEITISLHTLFAPLWVIDYIIIHELCHLIHHDHSPDFWKLVERFYPKFKLAKKYLNNEGLSLIF